jgi:hypothetical protein
MVFEPFFPAIEGEATILPLGQVPGVNPGGQARITQKISAGRMVLFFKPVDDPFQFQDGPFADADFPARGDPDFVVFHRAFLCKNRRKEALFPVYTSDLAGINGRPEKMCS